MARMQGATTSHRPVCWRALRVCACACRTDATRFYAASVLHPGDRAVIPIAAADDGRRRLDDYKTARDLLTPVFDSITAEGATPAIRATVDAMDGQEMTLTVLAARLKLGKST